jgi:GxxExxY protein
MKENDISFLVRGAIFKIFKEYGPGLLESTYEALLVYELNKSGLKVANQVPLPLIHEGIKLPIGYRLDILVADLVIVEIKSVEQLSEVHHKQLITYLKLSGKKLGILVNFNCASIEKSMFRKINGILN